MLKTGLILFFFALWAVPAAADETSVRETIVSELQSEGYEEIRISRTWLGRTRFVAQNGRRYREIVVNPTTGVILRDYIKFLNFDDDDEFEDDDDDEEEEEEDDDDDDDDDDEDDDDPDDDD